MLVIKFIFKNTIKYVCLLLLGFFKKGKNIFYKSRFYLQLKKIKTIKYFFIFLFRIIEKEKYYHINFYNYLLFRISEKSYCNQIIISSYY